MPDGTAAIDAFEERTGLESVAGGRHVGWGTQNRIVPLATTYVELVWVADAGEADTSPFGRWVASARGNEPLGWVVRTTELDAIGQRLGLELSEGARPGPDGSQLRWRVAGVDVAARTPSLPFFVEWAAGSAHPGQGGPAVPLAVSVGGDRASLEEWLGGSEPPCEVVPGPPVVVSVTLGDNRPIVLRRAT